MSKIPSYPFPILSILSEAENILQPFFAQIKKNRLIERLWKKDWTIWSSKPEGIVDRLGWLEAPLKMIPLATEIKQFVNQIREENFHQALLLGIGGSSLAPEVLGQLFPTLPGFLDLQVLDSTLPAVILQKDRLCPPSKTLYLVSSKSGTTTETMTLFHYFFSRSGTDLGKKQALAHFVAITDPLTPLNSLASSLNFRKIWLSDPSIGGRFSALSPFGLVPAALKGIDISALLSSSEKMIALCQEDNIEDNPGAILASFLAALAAQGRNKLLLWIEPELDGLGDWLEQIIAESTGKEGQGFLPVIGQEELMELISLEDVAFIWIGTEASPFGYLQQKLSRHKVPAVFLAFEPQKEIGAIFFLWKWVIALASSFLKINPFNQPDVEKTKIITQALLKDLKERGSLPPLPGKIQWENLTLYSPSPSPSLADALIDFLNSSRRADYLCLQAFLPPEPEIKTNLQQLAQILTSRSQRPVTIGWGPRYLHSTGQLHKGGSHGSFFWQLTADDEEDLIIPNFPEEKKGWLTFGLLKEAQVRSDYQALLALGRQVIRTHFGPNYIIGLKELRELINKIY